MKITNQWNTVEVSEIKFYKGDDDRFYYQDKNGEFHLLYLTVHSPNGYTSVHVSESHHYYEVKE